MSEPLSALSDPLMLARIQFAANISFHILFPTVTIALAWVLLYFKLRFNATQDARWMEAYRFWVKVFALSFALGVVSGVTMSFQFGTNWPGYMETVGNVAGPLLAYEVLTAFFLEATFLGIMLFGTGRVSPRMHTLATFLVAFGTTLSAFWILALNAWMQTPAGFEMIDGQAHVTDWWAVIFNPSFGYRLAHMLLASGITAAFVIAGVSAYRWQRGDRAPDVMVALRAGVLVAAVLTPTQVVVGDLLGLNTLKHQPAKVAAIEGIWSTERGAPLLLFGLPDEATRSNRYALGIPRGASLVLTHELDGLLRGLDEFPGKHPPVAPVFWSFRIMVGVGLLMLAASWWTAWQLRPARPARKRATGRTPDLSPWSARLLVILSFSGWIATLAGWYVTEIGRQPWLVYGVLTTAQAVGPIGVPMLASTLAMYLALYLLLIAAYVSVVFYMARKAGETKARPPGFVPGEPAASADGKPVATAGSSA